MQRWIALGLLTMFLMLGAGGYFALRSYKQNRPDSMWVPLPINPELPIEKRDEIAKKIKDELIKSERLLKVSKDLDLPAKMGLKSHDEAASELAKRIFVNVGEAESQMGIKVPSINVGANGKRKETELLGKIAIRLTAEVRQLFDINTAPSDPP